MLRVHREPVWSGALTAPVASLIPVRSRPAALAAIKAFHTVVFFSVGGLILLFAWDGLRQRPGRRTAVAATVALVESAIYASNNQVCPLTPLAEELGAKRGSVADIFLPDWFSQRIPLFGGTTLLVGVVLNLRAWLGDGRGTSRRRVGLAAGGIESVIGARMARSCLYSTMHEGDAKEGRGR